MVLPGFFRPSPVSSGMIVIVPDPMVQELDHLFFEGHLGLNLMMVMVAVIVVVVVTMIVFVVVMMGHNASLLSLYKCGSLNSDMNSISFLKKMATP
jgi:hypothetical protein